MEIVLGLLFFIILIVFTCYFVSSQQKLNELSKCDKKIHNLLLWSQVLPIWNFIAIPIVLVKFNSQFKNYLHLEKTTEIKKYSPLFGWLAYITLITGIVIPVLKVFSFLFLITYWYHISTVNDSMLKAVKEA